MMATPVPQRPWDSLIPVALLSVIHVTSVLGWFQLTMATFYPFWYLTFLVFLMYLDGSYNIGFSFQVIYTVSSRAPCKKKIWHMLCGLGDFLEPWFKSVQAPCIGNAKLHCMLKIQPGQHWPEWLSLCVPAWLNLGKHFPKQPFRCLHLN